MVDDQRLPVLLQTVLDCPDARALAEFYRRLLGLHYRPGDEPPAPGEPDPQGVDWLVLRGAGGARLTFQQVEQLAPVTCEVEVQHLRPQAVPAGPDAPQATRHQQRGESAHDPALGELGERVRQRPEDDEGGTEQRNAEDGEHRPAHHEQPAPDLLSRTLFDAIRR